jgi:spore coat protein A
VWQIGNEGGFLAAPVNVSADRSNRLLMALAERADVIVDLTNVPLGHHVLRNVGPDEPFGGGEPDEDFDAADPDTTGQILQFRVRAAIGTDDSTLPQFLQLPAITPLPAETLTRQLALIEKVDEGEGAEEEEIEGPVEALLGTVAGGVRTELEWMDPVTENPAVGATEVWEIYNTTADAHPMHIHEITFELVNRQRLVLDDDAVVQPIQLDQRPHSGRAGRERP